MKCPTCGFITDPAKDLCGRCFTDLRTQKIAFGMSVENPTATYEELLAKRVKIVAGKQSEAKISKGGFFSSLIKRNESQIDKKSDLTAENSLKEVEGKRLGGEPLGFASEDIAVPVTADMEGAEPEAQKLKLSKRQKRQMLGLLREKKTKDLQLEQRESLENRNLVLSKNPIKSLNVILREVPDPDAELWEQAFCELVGVFGKSSRPSSIQISSLLSKDSEAVLSVYFDLVFEEISIPDRKREFIDRFGERRVDAIESEDLKKAIGLYQKDSARLANQSGTDSSSSLLETSATPASLYTRFIAWFVDVFSALFLSLLIGLWLYCWRSSVVSDVLLGSTSLSKSDFYSGAIYALPTFYIILLLILPLTRVALGVTLGEFLTKIKLHPIGLKNLSIRKSIAWSLLSILAFISLGLIEFRRGPYLWREKILRARLLRT